MIDIPKVFSLPSSCTIVSEFVARIHGWDYVKKLYESIRLKK